MAAYLHDLAALKAVCYELVKKNSLTVMLSRSIMKLKTSHPAIWKQLRVALGLPEEDEEERRRRRRKKRVLSERAPAERPELASEREME